MSMSMRILCFLFLLLFLADVTYDHEDAVLASHDEHDCRDRADGPYGGGCLAFYRCKGGKTYYVECHQDFVFNRRAGRCDE